jgi:hypothetical protein
MRSRQVAEALGEDARAAQKAFLLNFPFIQQSKEELLRPDELDRKTAYELAGFLDKMSSSLSQAVSAMAIPAEAGKLTQGISEYLSAYNRATAYVRLYGRTGKLSSREEMAIQEKFDGVKPSLEQILNAHAAGTPIPEFRAVLESYDNISNKDLRPVNFSAPINIPQPAQPAPGPGQPAVLPIAPIVGPGVQRQPQPGPPAPLPPVQPAPAPVQAPPQPPALRVPPDLLLAANTQPARAWLLQNAPDVGNNRDRLALLRRERAALLQYQQDLAAYQAAVGALPAGAPVALPVAPQQPAQNVPQGLSRAEINLIRELEGNRQNVAQAEAALQAQPRNRQRREAMDVAQRKFRRAEERAIRAGVANIPYDQAMGAPKPPRVGDGMYGAASGVVSADMAGMDDEYLDLMLHDGFQDRGNFTGMMRALQHMPTAPFGAGAGMEVEEGEEMPYGTVGSAKRVAFLPDADYVSDDQENDEEYDDDNFYSREMAGRQQLDDDAEKIQANRLSKELKTAKGSAKNMREMLDKLRGKIKCR